MSLAKLACVTALALTLGACQSLFQPSYKTPLEATREKSEQLKPGCSGAECPLVNLDTVHFPAEPQLDAIIEKRLLQMTRTSPDAPLPASLVAYREQFLRSAADRHGMYLQSKVRDQHDGLVIIELASYLDTGAANGTPGRGFVNYSRQQHKALSLADMLLPDQEDRFWKAARVAHNNWLISTHLDREAEFVRAWPFQKTPNVALTRNAMTLKYDVSAIAPAPLGHVELQIPYERLRGIFKPELLPDAN